MGGDIQGKALDKDKFEKDMNVDLSVEKAFCIKEEGRYKDLNFSAVVPEIDKNGDADIVELQTGSIEITNRRSGVTFILGSSFSLRFIHTIYMCANTQKVLMCLYNNCKAVQKQYPN